MSSSNVNDDWDPAQQSESYVAESVNMHHPEIMRVKRKELKRAKKRAKASAKAEARAVSLAEEGARRRQAHLDSESTRREDAQGREDS